MILGSLVFVSFVLTDRRANRQDTSRQSYRHDCSPSYPKRRVNQGRVDLTENFSRHPEFHTRNVFLKWPSCDIYPHTWTPELRSITGSVVLFPAPIPFTSFSRGKQMLLGIQYRDFLNSCRICRDYRKEYDCVLRVCLGTC